jgi:hypothetical protein
MCSFWFCSGKAGRVRKEMEEEAGEEGEKSAGGEGEDPQGEGGEGEEERGEIREGKASHTVSTFPWIS